MGQAYNAARVIYRLGLVILFGGVVTSVVGYVFCLFAPNKYASLGLAKLLLGLDDRAASDVTLGARVRLAGLTGVLMMWLDLVIDPLAVRGDRWFLGRIFYYPEPGRYFGVNRR